MQRGPGASFRCGTFPSPAVALLRSSCCLPGLRAGSWAPWDPPCAPQLCLSPVVILLVSAWHSSLLCTAYLGGCTEILWRAGRWQHYKHRWGFCLSPSSCGFQKQCTSAPSLWPPSVLHWQQLSPFRVDVFTLSLCFLYPFSKPHVTVRAEAK